MEPLMYALACRWVRALVDEALESQSDADANVVYVFVQVKDEAGNK